jgi:hypothetical protein
MVYYWGAHEATRAKEVHLGRLLAADLAAGRLVLGLRRAMQRLAQIHA